MYTTMWSIHKGVNLTRLQVISKIRNRHAELDSASIEQLILWVMKILNQVQNDYKNFLRGLILILTVLFVQSCKKNDETEVKPMVEYGILVDIDSNEYVTVKIGDKWWMAENLKVTKYRDGTYVNEISNDTARWRTDALGAYCKYENDNTNIVNYGLLYNWHAVNNNKGLAPEGWHIPTDEEWMELEKQLGMTSQIAQNTGWRGTNQAEKLKVEGYEEWAEYKDVWQTNESGFAAKAGAGRVFNGLWAYPGLKQSAYWWTASVKDNLAYYRHMDYKNKNVFRYYCFKNYGFSVRCVKD
jgi:uncharacterized protein (TIGR02145 family)